MVMQSISNRVIAQTVCLTNGQIVRLQALSKETGKSLSALAREAVDKFFQKGD
jgi:predicted DNA-binding protein